MFHPSHALFRAAARCTPVQCRYGATATLRAHTTFRATPPTHTHTPLQVLGLVGTNGIGKSTALKILSGKTKPNLGKFDRVPDWEDVLAYFRGSELQNYFKRIVEDDLKASLKPQYVDSIPRSVRGSVKEVRLPRFTSPPSLLRSFG